jgi:hypothetical protein
VEGGLYRSPEQIKAGCVHRVFSSLHNTRDANTAKKRTHRQQIWDCIPGDKQKKVILLDLIALEPEFALHGELSTFDGCATRTGHSTVTPGSLEKLLNVEMKKTKNKYSSTYIAVGSRLNIYKKCLLLKQVKPTAPKTCGLGECRGSRWGT